MTQKSAKINDKIVNIANSSPDDTISKHEINLFNIDNVIRRIRTVSEYLKNLNRMFFLPKHVDKNGTVKIINIAKDLGYDNEKSKKLRLLLFHDIRNALSHINYEYKYDNNDNFKSITWFDMNKKSHETSDNDLIEILKKSLICWICMIDCITCFFYKKNKFNQNSPNVFWDRNYRET